MHRHCEAISPLMLEPFKGVRLKGPSALGADA